MTKMFFIASFFWFLGLPASSAPPVITQSGVEISTNAQTRTLLDSILVTNENFYIPIYSVTPSPSSVTGASLQSGRIHFYNGGVSYVSFQTTNGGRLIGTQRMFNNPSGTADQWSEFVEGTLNHSLWTNYVAVTNSRANYPIWTSRALGSAAWNTSSFLRHATNYTGISFAWQNEGSPGQTPITAISPWIGYARGHGMGGTSTNTANAGMKVYFVTAANAQITNTIAEQITRDDADDFTVFRFANALPATITPIPILDRNEIITKAPSTFASANYPVLRVTQTNAVLTDVSPYTGQALSGDSGGAVLKAIGDSLHFYGGVTTSGWTTTMSNCVVELLIRGGVSLSEGLPVKTSLSAYPTP